MLKWAPPSDNGATITKYTVASSRLQQDCATTTCTLTGLTNDVKYVFTVTATNEVGDRSPRPASNEIRPDEKPSPPEAPTVKAGDKNMVINWPPAKTEGSPVKSYNLEISPPPANGIAVKNGVTGLTYTWPGPDQRRAVQGPRPGRQRARPVRLGHLLRRRQPGRRAGRSGGADVRRGLRGGNHQPAAGELDRTGHQRRRRSGTTTSR